MTMHYETKLNPLALSTGPSWTSFEQFRKAGSQALETIKANTIGYLVTKTGQYRILHEQDFQRLIGLASEVERIRGGFRMVALAVNSVERHQDGASIELLSAALAFLAESAALPTRTGHDALELRVDADSSQATPTSASEDEDVDLFVSTALRPIETAQPLEAAVSSNPPTSVGSH